RLGARTRARVLEALSRLRAPAHDAFVSLRQNDGERARLVETIVQAAHAHVERTLGELSAHARRLARRVVHRDPAGRIAIERGEGRHPRALGVRPVDARERARDVLAHAPIPYAVELPLRAFA